MAPYDALTIPEIIREIVGHLRVDRHVGIYNYAEAQPAWATGSQQDMLSAALCCQAFKDPGLDILWDTLHGMKPLLKLIPGMQELDIRGDSEMVTLQMIFF